MTPRPTVLIVEDDEALRDAMVAHFDRVGYDVVEARDGEEAWEIASNEDIRFHVMVADLMMPRLSGAELARRMRERWPAVQVLLVSGAFDASEVDLESLVGVRFLEKPYTLTRIEGNVRELAALHGGLAIPPPPRTSPRSA